MTQYATAFRAMGCQVNLWLETEGDGAVLLAPIPQAIDQMEEVLSRFRPSSELSQLNGRTGEWVEVSSLLLNNLMAALKAAEITDGLFNPLILPALKAAGYDQSFSAQMTSKRLPPVAVVDWREIEVDMEARRVKLPATAELDFGGVAKGWIAQRIANDLAQHGACLVDAGGDLVGRGKPMWSNGWQVGIAEPSETEGETLLSITLSDAAVATSGIDYRHWQEGHHIIDPRSGRPAQTDIQSVTVIHPQATYAEAYAKAILIQGSQAGLAWFCQQNVRSYSAALVFCADGSVLSTSNFHQYVI